MNTKTFSKKTPYVVERLTAGFIARSKKKHGNKFDYTTPSSWVATKALSP